MEAELAACRTVLHSRRQRADDRRELACTLLRAAALAVLLAVLLSQVFLVTQATGNEMFPAIEDGDLLIGYRLIARPV